jgi:predicted dehydrogenase/nucleoside-diphosphate-sugar epimerase
MNRKSVRVGLVGAGYIASWHADAIAAIRGVELVAICDPALSAATALARAHGANAFASLSEMLAESGCDAVHILTPPHLHKDLAVESLAAGAHVFVEKPFALTRADCLEMVAAAAAAERVIGVNHNFLGLPSYQRLKRSIEDGAIGRTDSADITWRLPLAPIRSGPFGLWMLRAPQNLLLELGPHLYAFAIDLFGPLNDVELRVAKPIEIPGGVPHFQSWRVLARAGHVDVSLALSLVEGIDDRTLSLRGVSGAARLDFANDVLLLDRPNAADIVLNPLQRELSQAGQHLGQGTANAMRQLGSLNRKSPYALGFQGAIAAFYRALREGSPIDRSFSGDSAAEVIGAIEQTLRQLRAPSRTRASTALLQTPPGPTVLVTGGTGFIGRCLTRALVASGRRVRVLSRGRANLFADLGGGVEIIPASLKDSEGLLAAMAGVDAVFHLARAEETTWEGYLEHDVAVAEAIAEAVLAAGVRLLVYTGTIASYDASRPDRAITEGTDFGQDMERRNLYARSKALCEARLMEMHHSRGLPLVIARPGIVVGADGPLQHWGIGRWHGAGAVRVWGDGRNVIPLVLVDDVADGLIRILEAADLTGQSFNLVGEPLMSARDYFAAIQEQTNTRIRVVKGSLTASYLAGLAKYLLKRHALGRSDLVAPSLVDWKSRAHLSPFRNDRAKRILGWRPVSSRQDFVDRAIDGKSLFGF